MRVKLLFLLGAAVAVLLAVGCKSDDKSSKTKATKTTGSETTADTKPAPVPEKSLYERLGGVYAIGAVVDDFLNRLTANEVLNANPKIVEARDRVPPAGLKVAATQLICQVTGGPQKYTGRSLADSHWYMEITEKEWEALAGEFQATLDHFKVPAKEQKELFDIVGSVKKDILKPATPPDGPATTHKDGHKGKQGSLYERLGGLYSIATVVDAFVDRVQKNEVVLANPQVAAATSKIPKPSLKYLVTEYIVSAIGGPQSYTGRAMKESHGHLKITEKEWEAVGAELKASLDESKVPEKEQKELFEIIGSLKDDIVTAK